MHSRDDLYALVYIPKQIQNKNQYICTAKKFMRLSALGFSYKFWKLQHYSLAFIAGLKRATDEGSLPEIARYSPYYLPLNVFTASKGSNHYFKFPKIQVN